MRDVIYGQPLRPRLTQPSELELNCASKLVNVCCWCAPTADAKPIFKLKTEMSKKLKTLALKLREGFFYAEKNVCVLITNCYINWQILIFYSSSIAQPTDRSSYGTRNKASMVILLYTPYIHHKKMYLPPCK